jgi:branched-subunit amino acid transport protein AzlD
MAGNLEGHLTILIIIEMVIIKLLAQILPFVIIAERMAIEQWPSRQKKKVSI